MEEFIVKDELERIDAITHTSNDPRTILFEFIAETILKAISGEITKQIMDKMVDELFVRIERIRVFESGIKRQIN